MTHPTQPLGTNDRQAVAAALETQLTAPDQPDGEYAAQCAEALAHDDLLQRAAGEKTAEIAAGAAV